MQENLNNVNANIVSPQTIHTAKQAAVAVAILCVACSPALASTSGSDFEGVYTFIYDAATGYLGRAIALFAGVVGLALGAASGKAMPAIMGVILAIFGTLGPTIINSLFGSALI